MASGYEELSLPNVSVGLPSFNVLFPAAVTGVRLGRATEITNLLKPLEKVPFSPETLATLERVQDELEGCVHDQYERAPIDDLQIVRIRTRKLLTEGFAESFDFDANPDLVARYGITNTGDSRDPALIAAAVWQLIDTGLSRSVTAQLQTKLDAHGDDWATAHTARLRAGFEALNALLNDLRSTDPNLENTTVTVFSEFARTPKINGKGGRDHHFAGSILVFGGGLRRGVCGATVEQTLGLATIDPTSGRLDPAGRVLLPEDIGATLAKAAGLSHEAFRVSPLDAWIA